MKFGPVPIEEARGKILVHNITAADGRRALRKGHPLTAEDVETLRRLRQVRNEEIDLVILAGETAITDRHDITPGAVESAGGTVVGFGAPVDPGNLLMLAYLDQIPVVGAPGCARSPKENIVDLVLPRLLAGDRLRRDDIIARGHGGLLEDVPERPLPRTKIE